MNCGSLLLRWTRSRITTQGLSPSRVLSLVRRDIVALEFDLSLVVRQRVVVVRNIPGKLLPWRNGERGKGFNREHRFDGPVAYVRQRAVAGNPHTRADFLVVDADVVVLRLFGEA